MEWFNNLHWVWQTLIVVNLGLGALGIAIAILAFAGNASASGFRKAKKSVAPKKVAVSEAKKHDEEESAEKEQEDPHHPPKKKATDELPKPKGKGITKERIGMGCTGSTVFLFLIGAFWPIGGGYWPMIQNVLWTVIVLWLLYNIVSGPSRLRALGGLILFVIASVVFFGVPAGLSQKDPANGKLALTPEKADGIENSIFVGETVKKKSSSEAEKPIKVLPVKVTWSKHGMSFDPPLQKSGRYIIPKGFNSFTYSYHANDTNGVDVRRTAKPSDLNRPVSDGDNRSGAYIMEKDFALTGPDTAQIHTFILVPIDWVDSK